MVDLRNKATSLVVLIVLAIVISYNSVLCQEALFPTFADEETVALWLFDDPNYPHVTLTDASANEYDLRLMEGGKLIPGKFGNALSMSDGDDRSVAYAGFKGNIGLNHMRQKDGTPSGLWAPTAVPGNILKTLNNPDPDASFTLELWLRLPVAPKQEAVILDLGRAYDPGFQIRLSKGAAELIVENSYGGYVAIFSTEAATLTDGKWHHIAFMQGGLTGFEAGGQVSQLGLKLRHYVDGRRQKDSESEEIPEKPVPPICEPADRDHGHQGFTPQSSPDWCRQHRFNLSLGQNRKGGMKLTMLMDELRLSSVARYRGDFIPPGSFSRNYGSKAPKPAAANGPPLLFKPGSNQDVVELGSRKYLFVDDALIASKRNIDLVCNPPTNRQELNFRPDNPMWRPSVVDVDGKVYLYIPDGYGSSEGITRMRISTDGIHFTKPPDLGLYELKSSIHHRDIILYGVPIYAAFFRDLNPGITPQEQYKMTAWVANRGIYLYVSPDGIHWRRNETCMLPLASGGGAETYWDDQRGLYVNYIKADGSFYAEECPGDYETRRVRRAIMFETKEVSKPWPFNALEKPYFEGYPFPVVTCEGHVGIDADQNGEVYRTRALKYPWAPDTYVAFVWRLGEERVQKIDLGVSRNGVHWKFYANQKWYIEPGEEYGEVTAFYGLIRRGDELWQYADFGGKHGNATYARLTQRLDGFVSLDAVEEIGTMVTRPLIFEGKRLELNVAARGYVRVEILDGQGQPIPGFTLSDCDSIRADTVRQTVTWNDKSDVIGLAGKVIQVRFQMQNAKLYAIQFTD